MPKHSPEVYRRRRIAALLALVLAVAFLWVVISGILSLVKGGSDATTPGAVPPPSVSTTGKPTTKPAASPSATASASSEEYTVCYPELVQVEVSVDKPVYKPKEKPVLTLKVTNTSPSPCVVNVGTKLMEYQIINGNKQVFSTKDCQVGGEDLLKLIQPGKSEMARFTWNRNKSLPGCASGAGEAEPSMYQVVGVLDKNTSAPVTFELLAN